jgi:hypothetical protein
MTTAQHTQTLRMLHYHVPSAVEKRAGYTFLLNYVRAYTDQSQVTTDTP